MALRRTWYTVANVDLPNQTSDVMVHKSVLWTLKALLKGVGTGTAGTNGASGAPPASSRWTVEGSSDGASFGMDGADRWGDTFDATKVVFPGTSRSWVVLKSPAGATFGPLWLLIHCNSASTNVVTMHIAQTAFSGGGTNARPTSTTEFAVGHTNGVSFTDNGSIYLSGHKMQYVVSAEGHFMVLLTRSGMGAFPVRGAWGCWPIVGHASDLAPWAFYFNGPATNVNALKPNPTGLGGYFYGRGQANNVWTQLSGCIPHMSASPGAGATVIFDSMPGINTLASAWDEFPAPVMTTSLSPNQFRGLLEDWGFISTSAPIFGTLPESGPAERVNMGGSVIPFGVAPVA